MALAVVYITREQHGGGKGEYQLHPHQYSGYKTHVKEF
jgi:hypothetical protein